jgi:hypothetical protein
MSVRAAVIPAALAVDVLHALATRTASVAIMPTAACSTVRKGCRHERPFLPRARPAGARQAAQHSRSHAGQPPYYPNQWARPMPEYPVRLLDDEGDATHADTIVSASHDAIVRKVASMYRSRPGVEIWAGDRVVARLTAAQMSAIDSS